MNKLQIQRFAISLTIMAATTLSIVACDTFTPKTEAVGLDKAMLSVPFDSVGLQALEEARAYVLEKDNTLSPAAGGVLLHRIQHGSIAGLLPLVRPDFNSVRVPLLKAWLPKDPQGPVEISVSSWPDSLILNTEHFSSREMEHLQLLADHAAVGELGIVARLSDLDIVAARYRTPLPKSRTTAELDQPMFGPMHNIIAVEFAKAAVAMRNQRPDSAEVAMRELISIGFLLLDDSPLPIEGISGLRAVRSGLRGLQQIFTDRGLLIEAEKVAKLLERTEPHITDSDTPRRGHFSTAAIHIMENDAVPRSFRWGVLWNVLSLEGCSNLTDMPWRSRDDRRNWLAQAREALVTRDSENIYFDHMQASTRILRLRAEPCHF